MDDDLMSHSDRWRCWPGGQAGMSVRMRVWQARGEDSAGGCSWVGLTVPPALKAQAKEHDLYQPSIPALVAQRQPQAASSWNSYISYVLQHISVMCEPYTMRARVGLWPVTDDDASHIALICYCCIPYHTDCYCCLPHHT